MTSAVRPNEGAIRTLRLTRACDLVLCVALGSLAILFNGCDAREPAALKFQGATMGTTYTVKLSGMVDGIELEELKAEIDATLEGINDRMSTYRPDSELSRFNQSDDLGWFEVSNQTAEVVSASLEFNRLTGGAFDPTVSPWVELWSFGSDPRQNASPSQDEIDAVGKFVGAELIEVRADSPAIRKQFGGTQLDLSGVAKGYAVDCLAELLDRHGLQGYMIEVGGEVRTKGKNSKQRPWAIGIEAPQDDQRLLASVVRLDNASLATSGDYRNFFIEDGKRYSHLIDPRSGRPIEHRLGSVSVVDETCARADALATALMIMGFDAGTRFAESHDLAVLFIVRTDHGFQQRMTSRFKLTQGVE